MLEMMLVCRSAGSHQQVVASLLPLMGRRLVLSPPALGLPLEHRPWQGSESWGGLKSPLHSFLSPLTSAQAFSKCRSLVDYDFNEEYSRVPISG